MLTCGIDEAGRGPLAGPVAAAAVILPPDFPTDMLDDSKKLTARKRAVLEILIKERALAWGVAVVDHTVIDRINILQASLEAMKQAFEKMQLMYDSKNIGENVCAVVDGNFCPAIGVPCTAEPKADARYPSVMAASILAKEERDRIMIEYDKLYPEYGYAGHKGYPTKAHRDICREKGPSPIQRLTFSYK